MLSDNNPLILCNLISLTQMQSLILSLITSGTETVLHYSPNKK